MPKLKFKSHLEKPESSGFMAFIPVPANIFSQFGGKKPTRIVITVNNATTWKAAIMSLGNGSGYVSVSKKRIQEQKWQSGQIFTIQLEEDTDKETFPLPEEMAEILATDDEALHYYNMLTDGKKRSITVFINQTQNPQIRVDRSLTLIKKLKIFKGKGNMMLWLKKTDNPG